MSTASCTWYWAEDEDKVSEQDPSVVKAPNWVKFDDQSQITIEEAFSREERFIETPHHDAIVDFPLMEQINESNGSRRAVLRDVHEEECLEDEFPAELGELAANPEAIADELLEKLEREAINNQEVLFDEAPPDGILAFPAVYGSTNRDALTLELLNHWRTSSAPADDILAYVRFDDDGERLTLVQQLASAQEGAEQVTWKMRSRPRANICSQSRGPRWPWADLIDKMEAGERRRRRSWRSVLG